MFINIIKVIHIITIINKVLDWQQQQLLFEKGKGKGSSKQVFIIVCI